MQRKQAVTIKLHDIITSIFKDYEDTRPADLALSYQVAPTDSSKEGGLAADLAMHVGDAAVAGALGAVGGVKGVVAAAAHQGMKVVAKHIWQYFSDDSIESVDVHNLSYLQDETFGDNNNFCSPGDADRETIAKRKEILQKLYNHACTYQKLKGTRFGFRLFGFTFGEHRDDNVIDDFKYLVNILIGRKLLLAAKAGSFAVYQQHLEHLYKFLERISERPEILESKSNDTTYTSLRSVINRVKKDLLKQSDPVGILDIKDRLKTLCHDINLAFDNASHLLVEVKKRTTHLVCDLTPKDFFDAQHPDAFHQPGFRGRLKPAYYDLLNNVFYKNEPINSEKLDADVVAFIDGMRQHAGATLDARAKQVLQVNLKQLIVSKKALQTLLNTLKLLDDIKRGGENALLAVSDQLVYLLSDIKQAQFVLIKSQKAFVDALAAHCYQTANSTFKDSFTEHGYRRLLIDVIPVNNAIIALEEINLNKAAVVTAVAHQASDAIAAFKAAVKAPVDKDQPQVEPERVTEEDDTALKDWVMVNLDASVSANDFEKFANKVPVEVKALPWFRLPFANAALQRENELLRQQVAKADGIIVAKNAENVAKQVTIDALTRESQAEKATNQGAKAERDTLKVKAVLDARIDRHQKVFELFIQDYIGRNHHSSIWSWAHFHGSHGRDVASELRYHFNLRINDVKSNKDVTIENLSQIMQDVFIQLLNDKKDLLDGNFNPHSLKTYLLAYAGYLADENNIDKVRPLNSYHVQNYVTDKSKDVKKLYNELVGSHRPAPAVPPVEV